MAMTLWFKRSKSFVIQNDNEGTQKFLAVANSTPVSNVPNWVAFTSTFEQGVKDGSIVNLTPPAQMPKKKPATAVAVLDEPEEDLVDDAPVQTEVPKSPFGAQPMTPVMPAPKVGGVAPKRMPGSQGVR